MQLTNTRTIDAAPAAVWAALNDPGILKDCISGCESLERVTDTEWASVIASRVGPVSVRMKARILLTDIVAPSAYTLQFDGQGGAAGFARGTASVRLLEVARGKTDLTYTATATIGGKLAQIGSRLVDGVAAKLADEFFTRFAAQLAVPTARSDRQESVPEAAVAAVERVSMRPYLIAAAIVAACALGVYAWWS